MRRKYDLYINLQRADVNADALVLMNYKMTDAESPAAVFNSWSQQLALPRTSRNNAIFDHIYRADHKTMTGKFNALERTPFEIISETGEKLEAGYLKLTDISETEYTVVLYGGLGGFLFSLMYNGDGSKKSLADLQYTDGGGDGELDFNITRDAVREAWRTIGGQQAHSALWNIINFAPCYNGIPGGDFDAKKAFCYDGCYGVKASDGSYTSRRSHVMVNLVNAVDEWAAQDLRSYQQRPVISFKAIIAAIQRFATASGYTLYCDPIWFGSHNPYYEKLWLTLPKLDNIQLPNETGSGSAYFNGPNPGAVPSYGSDRVKDVEISGPWNTKGYTAKHNVSVTFVPTVLGSSMQTTGLAAWETPVTPSGRNYRRVVTAYQLLALDQNGIVIGGSKVAMASTRTVCSDSATPLEETVSPATFVQKYNNALSTHWNTFSPSWTPEDGNVYDSTMYNGAKYMNTGSGRQLVYSSNNPVEVTLSFSGVAGVSRVILRTTFIAIYSTGGVGIPYYQDQRNEMASSDAAAKMTFTSLSLNSGEDSYSYSVSGTAHSGSQISKKILLGSTKTPADYLLSYCKMFGLYFVTDESGKIIELRQRGVAYHLTDPVLDFQQRIDLSSVKIKPYVIKSRWYEWVQEVKGRFADYYKSVYGLDYGMARVNTGFEFDASHTNVLQDKVLKGAAEVLHQSKYFENISENMKLCPPPFIDGGSFTLWNSSGETQEQDIATPTNAATIEYYNDDYEGYDYPAYPKPEFCDKDNKEIDGADVLLLYDSAGGPARYGHFTLTDDNGLMTLYNEGKPCWLLGQGVISSNLKYTIGYRSDGSTLYFPRFRRMITGSSSPMTATYTLDMAVPQEIDQPAITCDASKGVYYKRWRNYINDRLDVDAKVMTCKADLRGLQVGRSLLGRICFYDGSLWALEGIKNYVLGGDQLTECELVKVNDKNNYYTGQN